jgi:hypothetical protein
MDEKHPNSSKLFRIQGHHVFVLYVTIPKLIIFPNIYTNPEIPKRLGEGERDLEGERD